MDYLNKFCVQLILLISLIGVITPQKKQQTDENRPYKFGFNIKGQQHRHEEKDENGLINGEFGFITADGVYHVTVYATDEQGRFKIVSMKSIKVSPPLDGSPDYSKTPIQSINNNAIQTTKPPLSTLKPFISTISNNFLTIQEYTTQSTLKPPENPPTIILQRPVNSCSSCSIPTTTKVPPIILPLLSQTPENNQLGFPNQNQVPKPINIQNPLSNTNYAQQNYPQSQPMNPIYIQNPLPNIVNSNNPLQNQNYPIQQSIRPNAPAISPSQELIAPFTSNEIVPPNLSQNIPSYPVTNFQEPNRAPNDNPGLQPEAPSIEFLSPIVSNDDNTITSKPNYPSQGIISPFTSNNNNNNYNQQSNPPSQVFAPQFVPNKDNNYNVQSKPHVQNPFPLVPNKIQQTNVPNISLPPANTFENNYQLQSLSPIITSTTEYSIPQIIKKPSPVIPEGLHFPGLIHPPSDPPPGENPIITGPMPPGITVDDMRDLMYKFNYSVGFHGHYEVGYRSGVKVGAYFVNGRDGYSRIVEYTADEYGFHPKVYYVYLGLDHPDIPKEETEKEYGLKGYIFEWYSIG